MAELRSVQKTTAALQKCRRGRKLAHAKRAHLRVCNDGLEAERAVGNYIVPMLVECGSLCAAQQVFNRLVHRNDHSWTSLILGYVHCGHSKHALKMYEEMREDGVCPSRHTLMALLQVCARLKDVERGRDIHMDVVQYGFKGDLFLGSALVDMYAKCGSVSQAQEIFCRLPARTVVSWTALIGGYAEYGLAQQVFACFESMQLEGVIPDTVTFICLLKACANVGAIEQGREMHIKIIEKGFDTDVFIGSALVDMYTKCDSLSEARTAFDKLPAKNVVTWTALIAGYANCGLTQEVLNLFDQIQLEGISPDTATYCCVLKACSIMGDIERGQEIHREIRDKGFDKDPFLGSMLIDMYAKSGFLIEAEKILEALTVTNIISWNAIIGGYAEHGPHEQALKWFTQMQLEGNSPDPVTYIFILKACARMGAIEKGREVHMETRFKGFEREPFLGNALVSMYAKCGAVAEAQEVFEKLPVQDVVSWTALISGYVEHGPHEQALRCFEQMQLEGILPNSFTFVCCLKACCSIGAIEKGWEMHADIERKGFDKDIFVGNTLIDMYAKCGSPLEAQEVFDNLPVRDIVSWNALIGGYAEYGPGQEALKFIHQMQYYGMLPNDITFICALKACGNIKSIDTGRQIHAEIAQRGFERELLVGNSLLNMYAKCGSVSEARKIFDNLPVQSIVTWNSLISGYAEHGPFQEAVICFERMQLEGVSPSAVTFVYVLKACGSIGAIEKGRVLHTAVTENGFDNDVFVGSALVDMYAKCGSLLEAQEAFDKLPMRNVASWSAMINGYGLNHKGYMAVQCFKDMQEHDVKPNAVTFTCLLTACSHNNQVLKCWDYFNIMMEEYGIVPTIDHYTCMTDLLARSGNLCEAEKFIETIPFFPSIETWTALLSACKTYGEAEIGLKCFQQLSKVNLGDTSSYVLMASVYANAGRRNDALSIEHQRRHAGLSKKPASALIEVNREVHEFVVGDNPIKEVLAMLEILDSHILEEECVPNLDYVMKPISDEEKEITVCEHAEKLAVAFGLLNTPRGESLRVIKNLTMCNNCHNVNKMISTIERRKIIVRDGYCVHHFISGSCSCRIMF